MQSVTRLNLRIGQLQKPTSALSLGVLGGGSDLDPAPINEQVRDQRPAGVVQENSP